MSVDRWFAIEFHAKFDMPSRHTFHNFPRELFCSSALILEQQGVWSGI
jgi:hypothetical protein